MNEYNKFLSAYNLMKVRLEMITFSEKAKGMLVKELQGSDRFVRIIVKRGGCAGMTYDAEIDTEKRQGESVVQNEAGIVVVSDQESTLFLDGLDIDYSDDLISAGFRFTNGSNSSSCGCGASFELAGFPTLNKKGVSCGS